MSAVYGRDGRLMVTSEEAAAWRGFKGPSRLATWRKWAQRRGIKARVYVRNPLGGQPIALWDLADIDAALDKSLTRLVS